MHIQKIYGRIFIMILPQAILLCGLVAVLSLTGLAQGKQSIVVLRPNAQTPSTCDGSAEIKYQIIYDLKLNNEDDVRLITGMSSGGGSVSRDTYDHARKVKIRDLIEVKWNGRSAFFAMSISGQEPVLALPDGIRPQKNSSLDMDAFYSTMATGEVREGKQKRKVSLALRDIWKIYPVLENANPNDSLFKHVADEKNVPLWEAFLRMSNNYRGSDANGYMHDALLICARAELDSFEKGDYAGIDRARQKAERAGSVKSDNASAQLLNEIRQSKERVDGLRNKVDQLIRSSRWDDAIDAAEPIKVYLSTWPDLREMFNHALNQSHEQHLFTGKEALKGEKLDIALKECTTAWHRLPDSAPALGCVCESRTQIALRDSKSSRAQKKPKEAKEILERKLQDHDCNSDTRVTAELKVANCEYSQQLFAEATELISAGSHAPSLAPEPSDKPRRPIRKPVAFIEPGDPQSQGKRRTGTAPKPESTAREAANAPVVRVKAITAANKNDFRSAREKLILANDLCPNENARALLDAANQNLSSFCVAEARKAIQRTHYGTAYVYLQTAQIYTPNDPTVMDLMTQAREDFGQRTRVSVGVIINDRTGRGAESFVNDISAEVEAVATKAGLSNPVVLDRGDATRALGAIQAGKSLNSPTAIFYGDLVAVGVRQTNNPRSVQSYFQYENADWQNADRSYNEAKDAYHQCRKAYAEAQCQGAKQEEDRRKNYRDRIQRFLQQTYVFSENSITVKGNLRLSFRFTESISRSVQDAETLEDSVSEQCVERSNVRQDDANGARDTQCAVADEGTYLARMLGKVKGEASSKALDRLTELPLRYYNRATSAANRQQGVEDYLRFLFLTNTKSSTQAEQAKRALLDYDLELKTDGVMR